MVADVGVKDESYWYDVEKLINDWMLDCVPLSMSAEGQEGITQMYLYLDAYKEYIIEKLDLLFDKYYRDRCDTYRINLVKKLVDQGLL